MSPALPGRRGRAEWARPRTGMSYGARNPRGMGHQPLDEEAAG